MMRFNGVKSFCLSCVVIVIGCKEKSPTEGYPPLPAKPIITTGYGAPLDVNYRKTWSDSSSEAYQGVISYNSEDYVSLVTNDGTEQYFKPPHYLFSGFKFPGMSQVWFLQPIPLLPDTLVTNQRYTRQASFSFQGFNYTLKYDYTLRDTTTETVPIGTFWACLWMNRVITVSANGQSQTDTQDFWIAQQPDIIKKIFNGGSPVVMVSGNVNGQEFGSSPNSIPSSQRHSALLTFLSAMQIR